MPREASSTETTSKIPRGQPISYPRWCRILQRERLPAAVVDLSAFDRNVERFANILTAAGRGHSLRVATKSIRVPRLIRRILDFGPPYQGLMCFSAEEAGYLAIEGFDDLLIAYPTLQPAALSRLRQLHCDGTSVRLMIDGVEAARTIDKAMHGVSRPFPLVLDVDMSLRPLGGKVHLGVRRSGIRTTEDVLRCFDACRDLDGVRLSALMGYEAQVAGLGDRNPFKKAMNPIFAWVRAASVRNVARRRREIRESLEAAGHKIDLFNGGGTGSATFAVEEPWLTELTVGSGFLCSHLFDYFSNVHPEPACFFALEASRRSDPGYITCQGGGYIASGEPGWDKVPVPYLPPGLKLVSSEGCGEVQTPLRGLAADAVEPGQPILFRHAKAGELAERFSEYLLIQEDLIVERTPTYRGRGWCFF